MDTTEKEKKEAHTRLEKSYANRAKKKGSIPHDDPKTKQQAMENFAALVGENFKLFNCLFKLKKATNKDLTLRFVEIIEQEPPSGTTYQFPQI
jgi:hypothetical protein